MLSLRSFSQRLKGLPDTDVNGVIVPEGLDRETVDKFLRVMRAETMSEISDISDEEFVDMYRNGNKLSSIICQDNQLATIAEKLKGKRSVMKRRVL